MTRSASRVCEKGYRSFAVNVLPALLELSGLLCARISKRGLEVFPLILSTQVKRRLKTTTFLLVAFVSAHYCIHHQNQNAPTQQI